MAGAVTPAWGIREVLPDEAEAFVRLRLRGLRDHPFAFAASEGEERQRSVAVTAGRMREARAAGGFVLGGFSEGGLVGTVGFFRQPWEKKRHQGAIWGVYVAPEARGSGLGRALLGEAVARARRLPGLEQIHLSVAVGGVAAHRLYAALGFVEYGREPRALKVGNAYDDEILMVLDLD